MNIRTKSLWSLCAVAGVLATGQTAAQAQAEVQANGNGRFYVELKDTNLADALEMIFKASGNPSHIIDEAAKSSPLASVVFPNITAESLVLQLARQTNFLVRKNQAGTTIVEPRAPRAAPGGAGVGAAPAAPTRVAPDPFGAALETEETTIVAQAQVARPPAAGGVMAPAGNTPPRNTTTYADDNEEETDIDPDEAEEEVKEYRAVIIRHVYAGGLAKLFAGGTIITTDQMVSPKSSGGGGGGGFSPIGGGGGYQQQNGYQQGYNNTGIDPNTGLPIGGGYGTGTGGGYGTGIGGIGGGVVGGGVIGGGGLGGIGGIGGGGIISDRNLKENLSDVDTKSVLDKVASLPIQSWNYKDQGEAIRHIGPMAQDFAGAFGVGEDDRRINMVDANGVTLASIQALYQITLEQSEQIKALQQELAKFKAQQGVADHNENQARAETPAR